MDKISIMHITHDLQIGGLQRVIVDIACNLDKSKYNVFVCALREGGVLEQELLDNDVKVITLPPSSTNVDYFSFWKLYKILKDVKPDIIHTHNTQPLFDGTVAAILGRVPVIVHTDHARNFPDKKRYMFGEWLLSHFIDQVVAVSDHTKSNLFNYEKIPLNKIQVVFNGINGDKYAIQVNKEGKKAELGINKNKKLILGLGVRLSNQKGITYLLKAMQLISKEFPEAILLIVGEGELWDELIAEVKQLGITDSVLFLGPRLDMNEILQVLDIYVLPSIWEGLPLVLLEAMAASLPIIATDVGGVSQVIKEGVNGILVKSKNEHILFEAIKKLLLDKEKRTMFAKNSRSLFEKQFTLGTMVQNYEVIYLNYIMPFKQSKL